MEKVLGIGFHKTGTTSLHKALRILGYDVCGPRRELASDLIKGDYSKILKITMHYNAFEDNPWPLLFRLFDKTYPNCKFVLTIRDEKKWINSVKNHFGFRKTKMRQWIYGVGSPVGNEDIYLKRYRRHNREVKKYFANRPNDLLILSLEQGHGWKELCSFLDHEIPNNSFPHANKRPDNSFAQFFKKTKDSFFHYKPPIFPKK